MIYSLFIFVLNIISLVFMLTMIISFVLKRILTSKNNNQSTTINVTPEEKESDMALIYEALDYYILKELHNFSTKDFNFTIDSDVASVYSGNYRSLIRCLLNPKQFINLNEGIGGEPEHRSFFIIFINKIYLNYIAETSNNIKSLLFKYYSGYTKENYFIDKKKRDEPSALPFITNYVRNYLWCRYEENENAEQKLLDSIHNGEKALGADSYELALKAYDNACCRKIALNIYHTNDIVEVSDKNSTTKLERIGKSAPKTISDFGLNVTEKELTKKDE